MNQDELYLDIIKNHHCRGGFHSLNNTKHCLLSANNIVFKQGLFEMAHLLEEIVDEWHPECRPAMNLTTELLPPDNYASLVPYFNDVWATHEQIVAVAEEFVIRRANA